LVAFIGSGFAAMFFMKLNSQAKRFKVYERIYVLALVGMPLSLIAVIFHGGVDKYGTEYSLFQIFELR